MGPALSCGPTRWEEEGQEGGQRTTSLLLAENANGGDRPRDSVPFKCGTAADPLGFNSQCGSA